MTFKEIIDDYIANSKPLFLGYVSVCCLVYLVKVLLTSYVYSKLFEENANFFAIIKEICGVWVLLCILYVVKSRLETKVVPDILSCIRRKLFKNYLKNNEVNFNDTDVSGDMNKILEVTRNIRDVFQWLLSTFIPTIVLMSCINLYFLYLFPKIGSVMLVGNIINFFIIYNDTSRLIESSNKRENDFLKMVETLDENVNNMLNIYLNDKVDDTINENEKIEKEYTNIYRMQQAELELFTTRLKTNNYIMSFLSMFLLYKTTSSHKEFVNGLLIFTFYLSTLENMSEDIPFSLMTIGNIQNIEDILTNKDINHIRINPVYDINNINKNVYESLDFFKGHITFRDVYFRYKDDGKWVLNNFSIDIPAGDKIALVSQSGFGKTTSMKILLGFYQAQQGQILLDGKPLSNFSKKDVRSAINYINQRTLLLHDTILNNMKYGNTKSTDDIIKLLKKYNLLKIFCSDGTNCLDKIVERNGTNISLGMQKVIYLVRGILKDNVKVYIFDEPLTSIDPDTRESVLNMIKAETGDKTVIIITHDKEVERIVKRTVNLMDIQNV
jgi:ABC-type multidrug transport system fused ATPase/permease subunit